MVSTFVLTYPSALLHVGSISIDEIFRAAVTSDQEFEQVSYTARSVTACILLCIVHYSLYDLRL